MMMPNAVTSRFVFHYCPEGCLPKDYPNHMLTSEAFILARRLHILHAPDILRKDRGVRGSANLISSALP